MKATLKYLAGINGPSGYGSRTTASQVSQDFSSLFLPLSPPPLTAIITGATSGIGAETARALAESGVRVIIPARDMKKAAAVKEEIEKKSPGADVVLLEIDLSSLASIRRFCAHFLSLGIPLNILINNAGRFSPNLEFSEEKHELTFATNYLGHFLLTEMLLEKMRKSAVESGIEGRIINVTSVAHNWVQPHHFCFSQLLNTKEIVSRRWRLDGVMHTTEFFYFVRPPLR
ncbi:hypothetical protein DM860_011314 [Cuscuta australis]|uniref:Uncharacterized protein n=1 Tax=Cuscuta australis TaxID=267555 RepID=A0A328DQ55_9ASTE|nr:hypothetical protein DM860_011314 [Cuscuta australis]